MCSEKPATVHLTQIVGNQVVKLDLCGECARQKGDNDPEGFSLLGLNSKPELVEPDFDKVIIKLPVMWKPEATDNRS